jgi:hypothetical protein
MLAVHSYQKAPQKVTTEMTTMIFIHFTADQAASDHQCDISKREISFKLLKEKNIERYVKS